MESASKLSFPRRFYPQFLITWRLIVTLINSNLSVSNIHLSLLEKYKSFHHLIFTLLHNIQMKYLLKKNCQIYLQIQNWNQDLLDNDTGPHKKEFDQTAAILSAILEIMGQKSSKISMSTTDACMKFEQNLLKKKKVRACQRISSNSCHMPVILETPCCRTPNSKLFRDSNKSDVCLKFEQNPLRMKKVIVHKKKKN